MEGGIRVEVSRQLTWFCDQPAVPPNLARALRPAAMVQRNASTQVRGRPRGGTYMYMDV